MPYIFNTKHCMEGAPGGLAKKIFRREINAVFSDKIIAVSKAVRRSMIAGGTKPQEIAVVYNGIERIPIPSAEEKAGTAFLLWRQGRGEGGRHGCPFGGSERP